VRELRLVATSDLEAPVYPPERASIPDLDQAFVKLGIDDEDARRRDDQVVDVRYDASDAAIVEGDDSR
jgi:hypothetical protein